MIQSYTYVLDVSTERKVDQNGTGAVQGVTNNGYNT